MVVELKDAEEILEAADYDSMPYFTSKIQARIGGSWQSVETYDAFYADIVCKLTKNLTGPAFQIKAMTGAFRAHTGPDVKSAIEQVDAQFFSASAGASTSMTHAEANAKVTLAGGDVSVFNFHLGAGVSTGGGIKDDSLSLKLAGCGVQVGRKIGISAFDNEIGVDLGKCTVM